MTVNLKDQSKDRLKLRSRLSEIAQAATWTETLSAVYSIPTDVQLAMNLCLEEVIANVIRHGYGGESDRTITLQFTKPRDGFFVFVVEDEAPHYNPLEAPEFPPLNPSEEIRVGGQGIRFLRQFADTLEYEPTPTGNRLRIGFSVPASDVEAH